MNKSLYLVKRKNQWGEYKIHYYENRKEIENGAYYTDDWDDAKRTFIHIAKSLNLTYTYLSGKKESLWTN